VTRDRRRRPPAPDAEAPDGVAPDSAPSDAAAAAWCEVVDALLAEPGVEPGTGFGAMPGLRTGGKIIAMLCRGELVVKLTAERADALVAAGTGTHLQWQPGGRRMRQWVSLPPGSGDWSALAREALAFAVVTAGQGRGITAEQSARSGRRRDR
jgi:hypothetical protein